MATRMLWYAAYGPSVNKERFLEHIRGGASRFDGTAYPGCRDRSDPIRDYALAIPRELYFARNVDAWGGAVGFVRPEPSKSQTLGRAYLITDEQFVDIACQENSRKPGDREMAFDYDYATANAESWFTRGSAGVPSAGGAQWYGRILNLGTRESWPVFTITAEWAGYGVVNAPGRTYVRCIADGIRQLGRISAGALADYFLAKRGIAERISRPVLERWLA